ncbi:MAG: response regulator, partial [Syntrophothermus sp.]
DSNLFAVLCIRDTGIGISEKDQDLIFHEFTQASEGYGRSHEGIGIGLTIAKKMTDLLNGSIGLTSTPGYGSVFTLRLPAVKISSRQGAFRTSRKLTVRPRVLVVEDNVINALVIRRNLKEICNIDHADKGTAAVRMAGQNKYDAVLMDINLGAGISGVEVTALLRQMPEYKSTPVAAVTGYTSSEDREDFLRNGFTHFLPKPFEKNEIVNLIHDMLS